VAEIPFQESKYIFATYNRREGTTLHLVSGSGSWVTDAEGRRYLDFLGGIAVNALGHCHPAVVKAVKGQVEQLIHVSNLYYTTPQVDLARLLVENSCMDRVFFANSGAEANEAAIKLARRYFQEVRGEARTDIITFFNSFHGRTLASLAATGQEKFHRGFAPLPAGFRYASFNDLQSVEREMDEKVCAVMIEPIQGESGIYPVQQEFLTGLRRLCDQTGSLLIFDEIQCGCGRTGSFFAYQHYQVKPDIITLAKALGGGLPIGAMLAKEELAAAFSPGSHASTFGGNPVVCAAATAVVKEILAPGFLNSVREKSWALKNGLEQLQASFPHRVKQVRGIGMMLGLQLANDDANQVRLNLQQQGLLVNSIGESVIRLLPPLNVTGEEIDRALSILLKVIKG